MITSFNVWEISRNKNSIIITKLVFAFCIQFLNWTFQGMQQGIWQKTNKQETEFSVQNYTVYDHILSVWEGQLRRMRNRNERPWGSFNNVCASVGRCSVLDGFSLQNITSWNILSLADSYTPGFFCICTDIDSWMLQWSAQLCSINGPVKETYQWKTYSANLTIQPTSFPCIEGWDEELQCLPIIHNLHSHSFIKIGEYSVRGRECLLGKLFNNLKKFNLGKSFFKFFCQEVIFSWQVLFRGTGLPDTSL